MNFLHLRFSLVASLMDPWGLLMQTCWPPLSDHWSIPHLTCLGLCSMAAWKLNGPICAMWWPLTTSQLLLLLQGIIMNCSVLNHVYWIEYRYLTVNDMLFCVYDDNWCCRIKFLTLLTLLYLYQCWHTISKVQWHSPQDNLPRNSSVIIW